MQKISFKFQYSIVVLLLSCSVLNAQHKHEPERIGAPRSEFSLYGGGGLSTLQYDVTVGKQKNGLGGHFGLGYHFFFSPKWGVGTGVEFAFYNAQYNLDNYNTRYMTADMEGNTFEFRSTATGYKEKQHSALIQIPLLLQFQTGSKHRFYAAAGGKIGISLSGKYENSNATIQNSGYYAKEDYEYTTQQFMGFGTFTGKNNDGSLSFKTAFFASAEVGIKWKLNESFSLYTGAYLDYGLNHIAVAQHAALPFIEYNAAKPRDFVENSIINSQYAEDKTAQSFTDKITPIAAGIKIRLAFGKSSKAKEEIHIPLVSIDTICIPSEQQKVQRRADEEATRRADAEHLAREQELQYLADTERAQQAVDWADAERMARRQEVQRIADAEKARQEEETHKRTEETQYLRELQQPVGVYDLAHTALNAMQKQKWDKNIGLLQRYPDIKIFIYGYTCNIGNDVINEKIGLQRAENVKAYLLSKGIAENRILGTASKRDTVPLVPNDTEKNRKINRRVEVVVQ